MPAGATPAWNSEGTLRTALTMATSQPINVPAHSAGDFLLLYAVLRNDDQDGAAATPPSNWNAFAGNTYGGAINCRFALFWKFGDGSETTATLVPTGGATNDLFLGAISRFTAADGFHASPVESISSVQTGTNATPLGPSVSQLGSNRLGVALAISDGNYTGTASFTGETGVDWVTQAHPNSSSGGDATVLLQTGALTGNTSGGSLSSFTGTFWATIGFALAPANIGGSLFRPPISPAMMSLLVR